MKNENKVEREGRMYKMEMEGKRVREGNKRGDERRGRGKRRIKRKRNERYEEKNKVWKEDRIMKWR